MKPYLAPAVEIFDRAAVPPEIMELWQEWPELDPQTARLIRAAVSRAIRSGCAGLGSCSQQEPI